MQLAPLYPWIHRLLKPTFPDCLWEGQPDSPAIALTFDDGPHPRYTLPLLDLLDQYQIPASFFWLGARVNQSPEVARSVYERGHWLGLHGYDHRSFPRLTTLELKQTLAQTQTAIAQACQVDLAWVQQSVRDVRPPNGLFTPQTLQHLRQWNYRPVMWSVVPEDWVRPGIDVACRRVLSQVGNGSVVVLHDGYHGGEDVLAIARHIIPILLQQGYHFVTIDHLWACKSSRFRSDVLATHGKR